MKRIDDINGEAMLLGILQTYKDFLFPRSFVYLCRQGIYDGRHFLVHARALVPAGGGNWPSP